MRFTRRVATMLNTSPAAGAEEPASKMIGSTNPVASNRLASGGPANWLATISAEYICPLACSRSASSTTAGKNVWALLSWITSHVPSSNVATSSTR